MPTKLTESDIETYALELLEKHDYQHIYGPNIAPSGETPERASFEDILLIERLKAAVARINPTIQETAKEDAMRQIQRLNSPNLVENNKAFTEC